MRPLTSDDIQALIRLMADTDDRTSALARERLLQANIEDVLPHLSAAVADPDALIRGRSRIFLEQLRLADLNNRWTRLAKAGGSEPDLEEGVFLIARYRYPEEEMGPYRRWLDEKAMRIRDELPAGQDMYRTIGVINKHLFGKGRLRGDAMRYFDPDNSCINRVIERRRGNPITLSAIYILIARRLGLPVRGVGMPGHFIVRYEHGDEHTWIDPFHQGRLLSRADCVRHIRRSGYPYRKQLLQPISDRSMLLRMLGNLQRIYTETEQLSQAEHMKGFQEILVRRGG